MSDEDLRGSKQAPAGGHEQPVFSPHRGEVVTSNTCDNMLKDTSALKQRFANDEFCGTSCVDLIFHKGSHQKPACTDRTQTPVRTQSCHAFSCRRTISLASLLGLRLWSSTSLSHSRMQHEGQRQKYAYKCHQRVVPVVARGRRAFWRQRWAGLGGTTSAFCPATSCTDDHASTPLAP